ncbi:MAG TPA: GNAT family N-acetyltransferase, partial [Gemmatimonadales bacterium]
EDGAAIGICGLLRRDYLDAPDIGYAFLERFQGQGYASEVTAATMTHAREELGLGRIYASVVPGNAGSIRVLEKLGMTYLRPLEREGETEVVSLYGTAE